MKYKIWVNYSKGELFTETAILSDYNMMMMLKKKSTVLYK